MYHMYVLYIHEFDCGMVEPFCLSTLQRRRVYTVFCTVCSTVERETGDTVRYCICILVLKKFILL